MEYSQIFLNCLSLKYKSYSFVVNYIECILKYVVSNELLKIAIGIVENKKTYN